MADVVTMPKLGFDMAEGTLIRWVKVEGDQVEKGELLAEIETDKATVEVESNFSGIVYNHIVDEGAIVPVGDPIAVIVSEGEEVDLSALLADIGADGPSEETEGEPAAAGPPVAAPTERVEAPMPVSGDGQLPDGVRASPVARRMAAEQGIDLTQITGSGPNNRIVRLDVETYLERAERIVEPAPVPPAPLPAISFEPRQDTYVPVSRLRAAVGRRMTESKTQLPHFYVTYDYDMAGVMAARKRLNQALEGTGIKLSVNDFIVKGVALTLREFPNLNASLMDDQILHHGAINVGIAVAVENGLLTVVCQGADQKPLRHISTEVKEMALRAREGKVRPDDVEGSTFTVSNLGMFDVDEFIAIINPPETAILAVGSVRQVPVVEDGEILIGTRMKATISVDHRISDGAEAAQFLQALAKYLEEPLLLMV